MSKRWSVPSIIALVLCLVLLSDWKSDSFALSNKYVINIVGVTPEDQFLKESDVLQILGVQVDEEDQAMGFPLIGAKQVDLRALEDRLGKNPFVKNCQVARDVKGQITVYIEENQPIARVLLSNQSKGFYLTAKGKTLPLSDNFTPHTLIITGEGTKMFKNKEFLSTLEGRELIETLNVIVNDPFWSVQCTQLDVNEKGDWVMYPQVGQHRFELGKLANMEEKLYLLRNAFYKKVLPLKGWGAYEKISVRYDGQLVCQ